MPFALRLASAAATDPALLWVVTMAVRRHRALQKPLELFAYLRFLKNRRIARSLEIGTLWGGTFYAHCAIAEPNGHAIAVDVFPRENAAWMRARFKTLARRRQQVTCVWRDSHSEAAVLEVKEALGGAALDLLFIDGDHSSEGARRDFETYSPLVRRGGVVAFHDIAAAGQDGIPTVWQTLSTCGECREFVDRLNPPHGLGIGVMVKP